MMDSLSVFFPAFNEEENIAETVKKAIAVLKKLQIKNWEVIVVNDGSSDQTAKVANELAHKEPRIRVITQSNGGYGHALKTGFSSAKYPWVVYTDSDGQFDFAEVEKFIDKTKEADLILGFRIKRNDPPLRLVFAKGWKFMIFLFFGMSVKDVDCGFKMARKKLIEQISPLESSRGGMINAELVLKARKSGFKISQVGVNHYPRLKGKPTGANLKVIINSFLDLFKLRLEMMGN